MIPWHVHKNHVTFVGPCTFTETAKERREKNQCRQGEWHRIKRLSIVDTEYNVYGWYLTLFLKKRKGKKSWEWDRKLTIFEICASPLVQSHMPLSSPQQIADIPVRSSWLRTYLHTQLLILCYLNCRCAITYVQISGLLQWSNFSFLLPFDDTICLNQGPAQHDS